MNHHPIARTIIDDMVEAEYCANGQFSDATMAYEFDRISTEACEMAALMAYDDGTKPEINVRDLLTRVRKDMSR